jgi:peptidoglycan hydrolase CwlO-like protein
MKKASLAVAFGLLALAACGRSNQDQLNQADVKQAGSLDELSDEAANVASEAQALENQADQLNQEAQAADSAAGAETTNDEDIQGM